MPSIIERSYTQLNQGPRCSIIIDSINNRVICFSYLIWERHRVRHNTFLSFLFSNDDYLFIVILFKCRIAQSARMMISLIITETKKEEQKKEKKKQHEK